MKRVFLSLAMLMALPAEAQSDPRLCTPWTKNAISALSLSSNRSFEIERSSQTTSLGLLVVQVRLTDANSSITRVRMTCTSSNDNNTTDHDLQSCVTSSGNCQSYDATWDQGDAVTGPGTSNWVWRVDDEGMEDVECTFAASGTAAAVDVVSVDWRECTKGG